MPPQLQPRTVKEDNGICIGKKKQRSSKLRRISDVFLCFSKAKQSHKFSVRKQRKRAELRPVMPRPPLYYMGATRKDHDHNAGAGD